MVGLTERRLHIITGIYKIQDRSRNRDKASLRIFIRVPRIWLRQRSTRVEDKAGLFGPERE